MPKMENTYNIILIIIIMPSSRPWHYNAFTETGTIQTMYTNQMAELKL